MRGAAAILAALLLAAAPARGQVSIVPGQHPVYDWIHFQRVLGNVDRFGYESQPLSRAEIVAALREIESHLDRMRATDVHLLAAYLQEFSPEGLSESSDENWFKGDGRPWERIARMFREQKEPHLFAKADSGFAYALDGFWSQGLISAEEGPETYQSVVSEKGFRAYASFYDHVGFHVEAGNLSALGDKQVLGLDELYNKTWEVAEEDRGNSNYFEAVASAKLGVLSAHIGHASLRYGGGPDAPLVLSTEAPTFDWVRVNIETGLFRYTALHGSLASPVGSGYLIIGQDTVRSRGATERWLAMHRIDFLPSDGFQLSFSEMITYHGRGADLAYLNPVAPAFFSELDNGIRDNAFWAMDARWRPVPGMEIFGSLLLDDASALSRVFLPERDDGANPDRAFAFGVNGGLPGGWSGGARYARVEPWVYTHHLQLNALEQRGFPLGSPLGPNADVWGVTVRKWLPGRAWMEARFEGSRRGLNPQGDEAGNRGGDLLDGSRPRGYGEIKFLEGADVQRWREIAVEGVWEPWRGVRLSALYRRRDVNEGDRTPERSHFDLRLKIGF